MKWPRLNAPDHPEYGAQLLLETSAGSVIAVIWTDMASSVGSVGAEGWASVRCAGALDELGAALERQGVPAGEAATIAAEVTTEWRRRWEAGTGAMRRPFFELWFYTTAIAVAVPVLTGVGVALRKLQRAFRLFPNE